MPSTLPTAGDRLRGHLAFLLHDVECIAWIQRLIESGQLSAIGLCECTFGTFPSCRLPSFNYLLLHSWRHPLPPSFMLIMETTVRRWSWCCYWKDMHKPALLSPEFNMKSTEILRLLGLNNLDPSGARACTAGFQCIKASSVASTTIYSPESCLGTT